MGSPAPLTSLRDILNLDKAEVVFQRLLDAVEAHSANLAALRRTVATKVGTDQLVGLFGEINDRLSALERRTTRTEAAVTIPGGGEAARTTVGEEVKTNSDMLRSALSQLQTKANKSELVSQGESLQARVRDRERAVRQWAVGRDFADSLGRAQRGLAEQMSALETVLSTKLDKTELDNMQAACAKVSTVSDFLVDTNERIQEVETNARRFENERIEHDSGVDNALRELRAEVAKKATECESQAVAQHLADFRRAFVAETNATRIRWRTLKEGGAELQESVARLSTSCTERLDDIQARLEETATKEEVERKADASDARETFRALRDDCASRALQSSMSTLEVTVSALQAEHGKTRRASDIAARFVDWFSTRGQAYEHNLAAVERHMENLAIRSVGARASAAPTTATAPAFDAARAARRGVRGGLGLASSERGAFATVAGDTAGVPYDRRIRFTPA